MLCKIKSKIDGYYVFGDCEHIDNRWECRAPIIYGRPNEPVLNETEGTWFVHDVNTEIEYEFDEATMQKLLEVLKTAPGICEEVFDQCIAS